MDSAKFFAVEPKRDCSHIETNFTNNYNFSTIDLKQPCKSCGDTEENWVCLKCFDIFCSRERNRHMIVHEDETNHEISLSFSDLSIWCYECDSYITHQSFGNLLDVVHKKKFSEPLPQRISEGLRALGVQVPTTTPPVEEGTRTTIQTPVKNKKQEEQEKVEDVFEEEEPGEVEEK